MGTSFLFYTVRFYFALTKPVLDVEKDREREKGRELNTKSTVIEKMFVKRPHLVVPLCTKLVSKKIYYYFKNNKFNNSKIKKKNFLSTVVLIELFYIDSIHFYIIEMYIEVYSIDN